MTKFTIPVKHLDYNGKPIEIIKQLKHTIKKLNITELNISSITF